MAGLRKEIWIAHVMKRFYLAATFLAVVKDMSEFVGNNVINLQEAGIRPDVLVNNSVFPIPIQSISETPISIQLDDFTTKPTHIKNAEAKQFAYNKLESDTIGHREALMENCETLAAYNYGPGGNTANTPVFQCTGAVEPVTGRKKMKKADLTKMASLFTKQKISRKGRYVVLHPDHLSDLLDEDEQALKQITNQVEGSVGRIAGWDVFEYVDTPYYTAATSVKLAFGAAPTPVDDQPSSIFFHKDEVMKADGSLDMFYEPAKPQYAGSLMNFQKFFVGLPIRGRGIGAVHS